MPRTIAISFLGYKQPDQQYRLAQYDFKQIPIAGWSGITPFMAEAVAREFDPDILYVLVTPEAEQQNFPDLQLNLADWNTTAPDGSKRLIPIPIPSGQNETETWKIFNELNKTIRRNVSEQDELIFDVTNGFRSLPILSFLAASFLKVFQNFKIKYLIYGAFDAGDDKTYKNPNSEHYNKIYRDTPVFNLTSFVDLLDWTTATSTFLHTGRADQLATLVREKNYPQSNTIADELEKFTQELLTTRPIGTMNAACKLQKAIHQPENTNEDLDIQKSDLQPFNMLLDRVKNEYANFALENPKTEEADNLRIQLDMIKWYVNKNLPIQAVTLAREWLVSFGVFLGNQDISDKNKKIEMYDYDNRQNIIVKFLKRENKVKFRVGKNKPKPKNNDEVYDLSNLRVLNLYISDMRNIWEKVDQEASEKQENSTNLPNMRNDLAHCGMSGKALPASQIHASLNNLYNDLDQIWQQYLTQHESIS